MSSNWVPLHNQTIGAIEAELRDANSILAKMIVDTLAGGSIQALNLVGLKELKTMFGPTMWDAPMLAGLEAHLGPCS